MRSSSSTCTGRVLTWNAGARALLGYTADDIVGRRFTVLHTKADNLLGKSETALEDALQWGRHDATGPLAAQGWHPAAGAPHRAAALRFLAEASSASACSRYDTEGGAKPVAVAGEPEVPVAAAAASASAKILVVDDNNGVLEEAVGTADPSRLRCRFGVERRGGARGARARRQGRPVVHRRRHAGRARRPRPGRPRRRSCVPA